MRSWMLTGLLLVACQGQEPATPAEAPAPEAAQPEAPAPAAETPPPAVNYRALVPSPLSIETSVREAGVADSLASLVPTDAPKYVEGDANATAVRTGVVLADAILAGEGAPSELLLARLEVIRSGMAAIGTGEGLLGTIDDLKAKIEQEGAGKKEFIQELDNIASMMIPEDGFGPDDKTGPLLQAGAWLEGSHLVAKAIRAGDKPEAASALLKEQQVVDYFLGYVQSQGEGKADDQVLDTLEQVLTTLSQVAAQDQLSPEDVEMIEVRTGQVLELL